MFPVAEGKWALSLGWGAWDRFHGGVQAHLHELPTPAGVALLGCLGLFVTIFVSPVQQRQWWGGGGLGTVGITKGDWDGGNLAEPQPRVLQAC